MILVILDGDALNGVIIIIFLAVRRASAVHSVYDKTFGKANAF